MYHYTKEKIKHKTLNATTIICSNNEITTNDERVHTGAERGRCGVLKKKGKTRLKDLQLD